MAKSKSKEKRFTTSKKILWASMLLFIVTVAIAIKFSYEGRDTSVFMCIFFPSQEELQGLLSYFI